MQNGELVQLYPLRAGALVVFDGQAEYQAIITEFTRVLHEDGHRFQGSSCIIDVGQRELTTHQLLELEDTVNQELGVRVLQIVNGEAADILREEYGFGEAGAPAAETGPPAGERRWEEVGDAYLLRRTVRSGQRVTYDGSIVVLGDVNPGAEILAGGDVIVLGALRGIAHAGARGYDAARIVALKLAPMQLRIANYIGRAPDDGGGSRYEPEVAYVRDGHIVVEALSPRADGASW